LRHRTTEDSRAKGLAASEQNVFVNAVFDIVLYGLIQFFLWQGQNVAWLIRFRLTRPGEFDTLLIVCETKIWLVFYQGQQPFFIANFPHYINRKKSIAIGNSWYHGIVVAWHHGFMVATMVPWCLGIMVS
jgi:hypothetical protein